MIRLFSFLTLLTFTWTCLVQAFAFSIPAPDNKTGSKLTLQAVELSAPNGMGVFKEHLAEESYAAKTWQKETSYKAGFSAPIVDMATAQNPLKAAVDTAINSTVIGSVKAMEGAQNDVAKGANALKLANSAVSDAKLLCNPKTAIQNFLMRFASINFGVSSVTSQMEAFQNMPTHIKTAWFYFDGKIWNHDGGAKLLATKVIVPNAIDVTMRSGTHHMNAETTAESASLSVNPLALANPATYAAAGSVNVSEQSSTHIQTIHDHATILADYVFIRSKNMLVTGASVRSKVIDVMLEDDLLLESVVNEINQTMEGTSVSLSASMAFGDGALEKVAGLGDMAFSDKEKKRRWIEQKTAFIATEQLYLTVGKNYITRSAHAKREGPDKAPDYHARDAAGNTLRFFERQMPITDNACAFYSLDIKGENGQSVRKSGTDLLLNHSGNEEIRNLLGYEIFDKTINSNEHDLRVLNAILPGMADYRASRETFRSCQSWSDMDALDDTIKQWAAAELTYRSYVEGYLSKSNVMLEYFNDTSSFKPMTSSMDALAKIKGYDLNIYVQAQDDTGAYSNDQLTLVHAFKGGDKPINIIHVAHDPKQPQRLNHFNRLEETQDFTKAAHRIEEHLPEENGAVETNKGFDIILPFATVGTFAANVRDGVKYLEDAQKIRLNDASARVKEQIAQKARSTGVTEQESADIQHEIDTVYDDVAEAKAIVNHLEEKQKRSESSSKSKKVTTTKAKAGRSKKLFEPRAGAASQTSIGQTPVSQKGLSAEKPLYGQTPTGFAETPTPAMVEEAKQDDAAMVYALNKLSHATLKLRTLGEQYPGIKSALGYTVKGIEIVARSAYYIKMTGSGSATGLAACGPLAANPYGAAACATVGGVVGLTTAFATEQVIASGIEEGIDKVAKTAGKQGRTAHESAKFEESIQNTAFYLGSVAALFGVKQVAKQAGVIGKGKNATANNAVPIQEFQNFSMSGKGSGTFVSNKYVNMQDILSKTVRKNLPKPSDRPLESPYYSSSFKARLNEGEHYPGIPDRIHFQECNKQLHVAMKNDLELATMMETLYPGLTKAIAPGSKGSFPTRFPPNLELTWHHHPQEIGVLELIPRPHHRGKGKVQQTLHPNGKGGREIWGGGRDK